MSYKNYVITILKSVLLKNIFSFYFSCDNMKNILSFKKYMHYEKSNI